MTQAINYSNPQNPNYSGVTINITNPSVNPITKPPCGHYYCPSCNQNQQIINSGNNEMNLTSPYYDNISVAKTDFPTNEATKESINTSYPPQYYLNNYNYVQPSKTLEQAQATSQYPNNEIKSEENVLSQKTEDIDMSVSKNIINNLNAQLEKEKELEENSEKTKIIALTNEYIMNLEEYLNNPNKEIRLMASTEILTRLNEDKDRYNDAALNALLNKMLQDPEKIIRTAALSAFASNLASGNEYTVKLLNDIQNNPEADEQDIIQAANILLNMSATTEIKYIPSKKENNDKMEDKNTTNALEEASDKLKEKQLEKLADTKLYTHNA